VEVVGLKPDLRETPELEEAVSSKMNASVTNESERKRAVRRTALWLALLAAAFYFAFIAMAVVRGN
jgi:hypothetical protein